MKKDITKLSLGKQMRAVGNALKKITDNPDGGTVTIDSGNGQNIVFTMPPLNKRKKLIWPSLIRRVG